MIQGLLFFGVEVEARMETAIRVVVTCILLAGICAVWSGSIDVTKTIRKPLEWLVSFKKEMHLDVDFKQILAANMRGQPCLLFYDLHFVNATGENLTVKKIVLRAQKPAGGQLEIELDGSDHRGGKGSERNFGRVDRGSDWTCEHCADRLEEPAAYFVPPHHALSWSCFCRQCCLHLRRDVA